MFPLVGGVTTSKGLPFSKGGIFLLEAEDGWESVPVRGNDCSPLRWPGGKNRGGNSSLICVL